MAQNDDQTKNDGQNSDQEYDNSDLAWQIYQLLYDFTGKVREKDRRKYVELQLSSGKILEIAGETDFNFKQGFGYSRVSKYENYLKDIPHKDEKYMKHYISALEICKKLTHSIVNISLMPRTGNLQAAKAGIGNDRLDTFIWALNSYYIGETSLLFNWSSYPNGPCLTEYFNLFKTDENDEDIYNYCHEIYRIENRALVDELIQSGKEAIDSYDKVINYMNLAYRFWRQKLCHIKSAIEGNKDKMSILSNNEIKYVEDCLEKLVEFIF